MSLFPSLTHQIARLRPKSSALGSTIVSNPRDLSLDLIRTTAALPHLFEVQIPSDPYGCSYIKQLIKCIEELNVPRFPKHKALDAQTLQPLKDSLETIDWLIGRITAPDFDTSKSVEASTESPELLMASARRYTTEGIVAEQTKLIASEIVEFLNATPPTPIIPKIDAPLDMQGYLARSKLLEAKGGDLEPDDDPIGSRNNSSVEAETNGIGEFYGDMCCSGQHGFFEEKTGKITAKSEKAFNMLGVKIPAILIGCAGKLCDLFSWISQNNSKFPELSNLLKSADLPQEVNDRPQYAIYEYPIEFETRRLPLPPKHEVIAISFFDSKGKVVAATNTSQHVTWSIFGGLETSPPIEAKSVRYIVQAIEWQMNQQTVDAFTAANENSEFYSPLSMRAAITVAAELAKDPEERAQFLFRIIKGQQFIPSHDFQIAQIINQSAQARNEVIAGLGCGNCTPVNYHLASLLKKAGIPSLVLMGDPILSEGIFLIKPGHSQAFAFSKTRGSTLDLTNDMAAYLSVNVDKIPADEWMSYSTKIKEGTLREAFETARKIRQRISCSPEETSSSAMHAAMSSIGGPRFSPLSGGDDSRSVNFFARTDLRHSPKLDRLAQIYSTKIFVDNFRRLAAIGIRTHDLSDLYTFCDQQGEFPSIQLAYHDSLPEEMKLYGSFDANYELQQISVAALQDPNFSSNGKSITANWLLKKVSYGRNPSIQAQHLLNKYASRDTTENLGKELKNLNTIIPLSCSELVFSHGEQGFTNVNLEKCLEIIFGLAKEHGRDLRFPSPNCHLHYSPRRLADVVPAIETLANIVSGIKESGQQLEKEVVLLTMLAAVGTLSESFHITNNNYIERPNSWDEFYGKAFEMPPAFEESVERTRSAATKILRFFAHSPEDKTLDLALLIAGYGNTNLQECWSWFREHCNFHAAELKPLFAWEARGDANLDIVTIKIAATLEKDLKNNYRFDLALPWLEDLGLKPKLAEILDTVKLAFSAAYQCDHSVKFNLPVPENPYSEILYYLYSCSRATLLESLYGISKSMSGDPHKLSQEIWPNVDELAVGRFILSMLLPYSGSTCSTQEMKISGENTKHPLSSAEIPAILEDLSDDLPAIRLAISVLKLRDTGKAKIANNFSKLKADLPEAWQHFIARSKSNFKNQLGPTLAKSIQTSAAIAIMQPLDQWQKYLALLGTNRIQAYIMLPAIAGEQWYETRWRSENPGKIPLLEYLNKWEEIFSSQHDKMAIFQFLMDEPICINRCNEFSNKLTVSEWGNALISAALLATASKHDGVMGIIGHGPQINLIDSTGRLDKDLAIGAWRETLLPNWTNGLDFWQIISKIRKIANQDFRNKKISKHQLSALTVQGKASIEVPVQSGGDFTEFRNMVRGDDIRHLDWKSFARSDRLFIKKYVDIEPQVGVIVVDLEWLSEGVSLDSLNDREGPAPTPLALRSLYTELYSTAREKSYPHLIFCIRGDLVSYHDPKAVQDILSHRPMPKNEREYWEHNCPRFSDEAFLFGLLQKMQRCGAALATESKWRPGGYYPSNALRDVPVEILAKLPKRSRILACIHGRNRTPTLKYLRAISHKLGARVAEI